jgi:chromosome segregation ATPase
MGGVIGDARKRQSEVAAEQVLTAPLPVDDMRAQYQQQVSAAYDEVDRLTDRGRQLAAEVTRQTARAESLLEESRRQHARADALEVERDEARQTCCACHSVARLERDEARANRDRLAHEVAALRRQVADLTAEHHRALESARKLFVETRDLRIRAEAAERALAARDEVIARVRTLADEWMRTADRWSEHLPNTAIHRAHANRLRTALAVSEPADETFNHILIVSEPGRSRCTCGGWTPQLGESISRAFDKHLLDVRTPPTTDAKEATDHG